MSSTAILGQRLGSNHLIIWGGGAGIFLKKIIGFEHRTKKIICCRAWRKKIICAEYAAKKINYFQRSMFDLRYQFSHISVTSYSVSEAINLWYVRVFNCQIFLVETHVHGHITICLWLNSVFFYLPS